MKTYLSIIRPQQWFKNLFVFLPAFFGGRLLCADCVVATLWAFAAFCLVASSIYCLNDILDVEADRRHPIKCRRPLASGRLPLWGAWLMMWLMLLAWVAIAVWHFGNDPTAYGILAVYFLLNVAYCFWLKRIAIVDVFTISLGFVFRLVLGGVVCGIWLSPWIICLTFLLALLLAFAKRRDDVVLLENGGEITRKNVAAYNLPFMNQTLGLLGAITTVCYIIYSVSPDVEERLHSQYVYVSSIFVLAGILRYLQLSIVQDHSGSPTRVLLTDRFLQFCISAWVIFFVFVLYV